MRIFRHKYTKILENQRAIWFKIVQIIKNKQTNSLLSQAVRSPPCGNSVLACSKFCAVSRATDGTTLPSAVTSLSIWQSSHLLDTDSCFFLFIHLIQLNQILLSRLNYFFQLRFHGRSTGSIAVWI